MTFPVTRPKSLRLRAILIAPLLAAAMTAGFVTAASAENGGDREPAGGAFNSSYSQNPYRSDARPGSIYEQPGYDRQSSVRDPATTGSVQRSTRPRRTPR